jgi:hypothetical protein
MIFKKFIEQLVKKDPQYHAIKALPQMMVARKSTKNLIIS